MRPAGKPWQGHMTTEDAIKIIEEARPENVIITHFGMQMIFRGPRNEARLIENKTGVPTIAANDGMHIRISEQIEIIKKKGKNQLNLENFFKAHK